MCGRERREIVDGVPDMRKPRIYCEKCRYLSDLNDYGEPDGRIIHPGMGAIV